MTAPKSVDPAAFLREQLEPRRARICCGTMVKTFADALMSAEADAVCGAAYGERSDERTNSRNGYRPREWDTRAGTVELAIPKLRTGSYFPDWLLQHRRRAEQALVVGGGHQLPAGGVDPAGGEAGRAARRRVSCPSRRSRRWPRIWTRRSRRSATGRWTPARTRSCGCDALTMKVREDGRTVNVHALIAVGVNADGQREVLGLDVCLAARTAPAGWRSCARLTARGLSGVRLVISDAHRGLVDAIGATLPGAAWQRCRTHYLRNLLTKVPKSAQPWVATMVRTIFDQPDAAAVRAQFGRVVDTIAAKFPDAGEHLDDARDDLLAFAAFPHEIWRQIWSNNPQERLNKEIRRRTDVVGIFPNRAAIIRLVGAVLAEQTDEWTEQRRYMGIEILAKARTHRPRRPSEAPPPRTRQPQRSPHNINPDLPGDRLLHHHRGRDPVLASATPTPATPTSSPPNAVNEPPSAANANDAGDHPHPAPTSPRRPEYQHRQRMCQRKNGPRS